MDERRLFRAEVIAAKRNHLYGSVSINTPIRYRVYTIVVVVLVMGIIFFVAWGEYAEKFIVNGYIESSKGVSRIYAAKKGVILKRFVQLGDKVQQGAPLFLIDTRQETLDIDHQENILEHLEQKKRSIEASLAEKTKHLLALKTLLDKRYIALAFYQQKQDEWQALVRQKNTVDVEIIQHKNETSYLIRAPIDGVITSLIYQEGQYTDQSKPLAKMIPSEADFRAELYVPVKQSGFLNANNKVILRYDAYPYARFGDTKATIHEISRSILTDEEEDKPIHVGQPYYKVSANLSHQYIWVYGQKKRIQQGMTLSAVIIGSKKRIWQWILDPLYSFSVGVV